MSISEGQPAPKRIAVPELIIGLGVVGFALLALWQTLSIPVSPMYAKVGPTAFPYLTVAGLSLLGVLLVVAAVRGGWQSAEEKETPIDWKGVGFVVAGLLANLVLIQPLDFTAASVIMFVLVCYGFGSRRPLRDAGTGLALALVAYFGFAKLLGVNIGAGLVERLLGA
jgi:putative tricarboxylic transport membrane protein